MPPEPPDRTCQMSVAISTNCAPWGCNLKKMRKKIPRNLKIKSIWIWTPNWWRNVDRCKVDVSSICWQFCQKLCYPFSINCSQLNPRLLPRPRQLPILTFSQPLPLAELSGANSNGGNQWRTFILGWLQRSFCQTEWNLCLWLEDVNISKGATKQESQDQCGWGDWCHRGECEMLFDVVQTIGDIELNEIIFDDNEVIGMV